MLFDQFVQILPPEAVKIVLVLFLGFLIGLEREEHKASDSHYSFGGGRNDAAQRECRRDLVGRSQQ